MNYTVTLEPNEHVILTTLLGKSLDDVLDPDSPNSIRLSCDGLLIDFTPEEVATPEPEKPYADVTRPRVTNDQSQLRPDVTWRTLFCNVGRIWRIAILHTVVTFTPLLPSTSPDVTTVLYGSGEGWSAILHHPEQARLNNRTGLQEHAIVALDIGIALFTDAGQVLTISTDGTSFFVEAELQAAIAERLQPSVAVSFIE
jgi:hypothetical protein